MNDWLAIWEGDVALGFHSPEKVVFAMLLSFCLGHLAAWTYMYTHDGLSYSRLFPASLVAIPIIVSLLMLLMAGDVVIAFGLLAVFAVVRFRNVLKDTRDTTFVLWVIVIGMAVGTHRFSTAVIGTFFIGAVIVYMRLTHLGSRHRYDAILNLYWVGEETARQTLIKVLKRYGSRIELASERADGDGASASYRLLLRDPARGSDLLDELREIAGVSDPSLHLREDETEF